MNDGFINEHLLISYINNNDYNSYNNNIKSFLQFTFGQVLDVRLPFEAEQITYHIKPDLMIKHNQIYKFISLKKGSGNSVHQEKCTIFFDFIKELLGAECLKNLQLFHYGDDTINDTGIHRYSASECKNRYCNNIALFNKCINEWNYLHIFLDRFLFLGNVEDKVSVDVIYYGTIENGLWASKDEIKKYIKENNFNSNTVHFGPLTYQVWGRNENRRAVHPNRRYVMQIKWGGLYKDLTKIREKNNVTERYT